MWANLFQYARRFDSYIAKLIPHHSRAVRWICKILPVMIEVGRFWQGRDCLVHIGLRLKSDTQFTTENMSTEAYEATIEHVVYCFDVLNGHFANVHVPAPFPSAKQ